MQAYGIIFDCDGTLVDSLGAAMESFNYTLDKMGFKPRDEQEIKRHFGAGADRIFTAILGSEEAGLKAFEYYVDHQSELALQIKLHDGVLKMLEQFADQGIRMGVVTGRHARDLDVVLRPHKIADYFVTLIADNHLPNSKPAPDGILLAAQKMNLDPKRTLYVGDSVMDMQAAHGAGSAPVAALWDRLVKRSAMEAEQPKYMAEHPSDIFGIFRRFTG